MSPEYLPVWIKSLNPASPDPIGVEEAIGQLLSGLRTNWLLRLDADMRWRSGWYRHDWDAMTPEQAANLIERASDPGTVAAGLSMHRNGHIRELAVGVLASLNSVQSLRWLVLRSADWVEQVREPARAGLVNLLTAESADSLVDALPLLDGGRFDLDRRSHDLREPIEKVLRLAESRGALWRGLSSTVKATRQTAVRLLLGSGSDIELLRHVAIIGDASCISTVASAIPNTGPVGKESGEILLSPWLGPQLRSQGVWRLTAGEPDDEARAVAQAGLVDAAMTVREVAQRRINEWDGPASDAAFYRSLLDSEPLVGLRGLGDRPDERDAERCVGYLSHEVSAVRVAALRYLARLGRPTDRQIFAEFFLSGTSRERREAASGLEKTGGGAVAKYLWQEAVRVDKAAVARRVLFLILPMADKWVRLEIGLEAAVNPDADIRAAGCEALRRTIGTWNRGYSPEPTVDLLSLRSDLVAARPVLDRPDRPRNLNLFEALDYLIPELPG